MPNDMETRGKLSLEYLAGIFDGEGCCTILRYKLHGQDTAGQQRHYTLRAQVGMIQKIIPQVFYERWGGCLRWDSNRRGKQGIWCWNMTGNKQTRKFYEDMLPYLIVKREQVEVALKFLDGLRIPFNRKIGMPSEQLAFRESCYWKLRELKGNAPATTERNGPATGSDSLNPQETAGEASEAVPPLSIN